MLWMATPLRCFLLNLALLTCGPQHRGSLTRASSEGVWPWWSSCQNPELPKAYIPWNISQHANLYGIEIQCFYKVDWVKSDFITQLMESDGGDPDAYTFRVCMDKNRDSSQRHFPWVHTTTADWRGTLAARGSIIMNPQQLKEVWDKGFQQMLPDALDYYARYGRVNFNDGTSTDILPKFMLYGWSKGATYNWPLGRWRPDVVQGNVLLHGCKKNKCFKKVWDKKAAKEGLAPHLFYSSMNDGYLKCSSEHSRKTWKSLANLNDLQFHQETPCGHHPDRCWSGCDMANTFFKPFWDFVDTAYRWHACETPTNKNQCESMLCKWDSDLGVCDEYFPTALRPSCEKFCGKIPVASCDQALFGECADSYTILSESVADAAGMHALCEVAGMQCVQKAETFQCLFQDRCPQSP